MRRFSWIRNWKICLENHREWKSLYKFSGCYITCSMFFCKKKLQQHSIIRYAYSYLPAFLAPEHAWRCPCLEGAGDMKTLTCSPAHASLLHFCQQNCGNGVGEELSSFLLPPFVTPYSTAESSSFESRRSMFQCIPACFGEGLQLFCLREDEVTMALHDIF